MVPCVAIALRFAYSTLALTASLVLGSYSVSVVLTSRDLGARNNVGNAACRTFSRNKASPSPPIREKGAASVLRQRYMTPFSSSTFLFSSPVAKGINPTRHPIFRPCHGSVTAVLLIVATSSVLELNFVSPAQARPKTTTKDAQKMSLPVILMPPFNCLHSTPSRPGRTKKTKKERNEDLFVSRRQLYVPRKSNPIRVSAPSSLKSVTAEGNPRRASSNA